MASTDDTDSGMASLTTSSKDLTPEKANAPHIAEESDDDDDIDETIAERLWGLTEMFPESVRTASHLTCVSAKFGVSALYSFLRVSSWFIFSSAAILFAPVLFESERVQMEEMQKQQQRQILLGPNAAVAGSMGMGAPPVQR